MSTLQDVAAAIDQTEAMPTFSPWCFSWAKRALDLLLSGLLLVSIAPAMLLVAILVKTSSPGPAIFRQTRIGRNGRPFTIYKFRTMYCRENRGNGLTCYRDSRITPVGRFLRRRKLDELPQLFNVFAGTMSMVGPRPDLPEFVSSLPRDLRAVLSLKPGVTSLASMRYRNESVELGRGAESQVNRSYIERVLPDKVHIDLRYAKHASFMGDLALMFRTVIAIFERSSTQLEAQHR